jgi:hypothetical protein
VHHQRRTIFEEEGDHEDQEHPGGRWMTAPQ